MHASPENFYKDSFDYEPRTRLVFGCEKIDQIGDLAKELGGTRVLLVTDSGIVAAGHAQRVDDSLVAAGLLVVRFDDSRENPTTKCVDDCVAVAKAGDVDLIVGLGGGSSMDTAKGCNFIFTNGGRMKDYWGVGKATKPMLPLIAIPTTAGTGSECQSFALIADEITHAKMACGDLKAAPKISILDPSLTVSQPRRVTCCTGIDAIAHAVETAVTKKRNRLSTIFSKEGFRLCVESLPRVLANPGDLDARGNMLLGAAYAGTAIENSMLGAAHSAANPMTAHFGTIHGQAVGLLLPHIVRFNAQDLESRKAYAELASVAGLANLSDGLDQAVGALIARLETLLNLAEIPKTFVEAGGSADMIPLLAEEASKQWTANFNPREVGVAEFVELYTATLIERGTGDA
ncbi:iron-containing alcohol dehydrogenase [Verrucomicrobia bacterium]|nr:iron-containing alcohol dehydrogenase [Verrucomicrobiota bacterium]